MERGEGSFKGIYLETVEEFIDIFRPIKVSLLKGNLYYESSMCYIALIFKFISQNMFVWKQEFVQANGEYCTCIVLYTTSGK